MQLGVAESKSINSKTFKKLFSFFKHEFTHSWVRDNNTYEYKIMSNVLF